MYLKCNRRRKDGKEHRYWSIMENRRCAGGKMIQRHRLRKHAPGLTTRAAIEKLATIQMLDAYLPTTDGRCLIFARYTQPEKDHRMLLDLLSLQLPAQKPPRITGDKKLMIP